ncbi:hypothetical protein BCR42DRAFT_378374 [Absidia repens]|uniref:T6SS Phospholipase effector Tle1-like catalytic domain-containing protein n=1 Tax=Absidia repens TaxID=90262 RepID=A0A1X2IB52_9FUNG|nr:hypothetical protein BCR42DRAFT_378374 [Absidia repens]
MSETSPEEAVFRRRIILCMDGTWENPLSNTNVFRWFEHVNMSPHTFENEQWIQIPGYFKGVGLTDTGQEDPVGAAIGQGIDQQILDAYQFLGNTIHDYEKDEVWVIGFSRGAYAARSLVGMLYNVGMLGAHQMTPQNLISAYDFYRHRSLDTTPESPEAYKFRETYECQNPSIRFLGCFDTVGSLGIPRLPFYLGGSIFQQLFHQKYQFHDTNISPYVQSAFHAISIHEQRQWFRPVLMKYAEKPYCKQELTQIWFPGVHQDVGGGVDEHAPDTSHYVLPNKSLQWMMERGQERGMVFTKTIDDICHGGKFVLNDSYDSSIIYRLMARKDRVIDPRIFHDQGVHAIYESGDFSYITKEELASYPSRTLNRYLTYLKGQT